MLAGAGMTTVDRLAILYLALPVAIFFLTWFKPAYAIPFGIAALAGLPLLLPLTPSRLSRRTFVLALVLALSWTALSGASHFFYAGEALNWPIRDAALRDLVLLDSPVTYRAEEGTATILRAPIAFYMVPAVLGKIIGVQQVFVLLYLWTALGVLIFLLQVMEDQRDWKPLILTAAVVVLFSGMDLLGPQEMIPDPATHQVWQAFFYQSTYNANLLIGFPNHAVPGWLATALVYRCRDDPRFLRIAAWVGALTLLWAPLVSIGLLPFLAALAWRHLRAGSWRPLLSAANLLAAPLVALPSALYLTVAAGTIATVGVSGGALPPDWQDFLPIYARFMIVEFGALAVVLLYVHRDGIEPVSFGIAIACLLLLPWFHFGPNNDLVTRGSIPAFTILMFTVIDGWARPARVAGRGLIVTSLLVVGAIMPVARMGLVFARPVWAPDLQHSLYEVSKGVSPNYLADVAEGSLLGRLLKDAAPPVR